MEPVHPQNPFPECSVFWKTLRKGNLPRFQGYVQLLVGQIARPATASLTTGSLILASSACFADVCTSVQPTTPYSLPQSVLPFLVMSNHITTSSNDIANLRASLASPRCLYPMAALNTTANAAPTGAPTDDPRGREIDADPCQ